MSIRPSLAGYSIIRTRGGRDGEIQTGIVLTDRENEVLKMAALGFTNKEIAAKLGVGIKSVETYKARGSDKAGLKTRADIVRFASAQGWLEGL